LAIPISDVMPRRVDLRRCWLSHLVSSKFILKFVSFLWRHPRTVPLTWPRW
jgi:hypothetical protein